MVTKITSPTHGSHDIFYDSEDHDLILSYKWVPKKDHKNGRFYAYTYIKSLKKCVFLHNFILGITGIDHRNGNGLDNRRCNLRRASPSQNGHNAIPKIGNKGVSFDKDRDSYRVRIKVNGKTIHGGKRYKTHQEALIRYNELAKFYFGEFAYINPV